MSILSSIWTPSDAWGYQIDWPPLEKPRQPWLVPVLGVPGEVFTMRERLEMMGFEVVSS